MDPLKFHTRRLTHSQEQSPKKNEKTSITTTYLKHWRGPGIMTRCVDKGFGLYYTELNFGGKLATKGRKPCPSVLASKGVVWGPYLASTAFFVFWVSGPRR